MKGKNSPLYSYRKGGLKMSRNEKRMKDITKNSKQTGEAGFRLPVLTFSPQSLIFLSFLSDNCK